MVSMVDPVTAAVLVAVAAGTAAGQDSGRTPFQARTVRLTGTIVLHGPVDEVFHLFSPLGEKKWVEGWDPEILSPRGGDWAEGMVFRTVSQGQEEIWVVAELDRQGKRVVYYRTEPGRLVARVEVGCRALDPGRTEATTVYSYVGLSDAGNAQVAEWTDTAYRSKMERWEKIINDYLHAVRK
jgi:hypothetical protein